MSKTVIKPYIRNAKYYETDQMGIIHHSNYIRWMEEARLDVMKQAGISYRELEEMGIIIPVLSVSCQYKSMVHFDDTVEISVKTVKYTGVKFELEYEFKDAETGKTYTTGASSNCFLDRDYRVISLKHQNPGLHEKFKKMLEL